MRRYPLSLLVEAAGCSEAALGRRVGLSGTTLKNARLHGFTEQAADRYACRLGRHASDVWPDFGTVACALDGCAERFRPHRAGHIYHDRRCARKAWARTPEGKASLAAAKARWLVDAWEYDRRQQRERKQRVRDRAKATAA